VITPGADGYLVPVGDADGLADHARRVLADPAHRAALSAHAVVSAQRFTAEASLARYHAALEARA
jgi:glycosyltransferase involved in cell wall biosynthesis